MFPSLSFKSPSTSPPTHRPHLSFPALRNTPRISLLLFSILTPTPSPTPTMPSYTEPQNWSPHLQTHTRVDLLKTLQNLTEQTFVSSDKYATERDALGSSETDRRKLLNAAVHQQWEGIEEYSVEWYRVLSACSVRQEIQRRAVMWVLDELDHRFNELETTLIYHGAIIGGLYDVWFKKWVQRNQDLELSKQLEEADKNGTIPKEFYNHYTVISIDNEGNFSHTAYGEFFKEEITPIVAAMRTCAGQLKKIQTDDESVAKQYAEYFELYAHCLEEADISKLEDLWTQLDIKWLGIRYWIQVVHDIEYGYGEPLRIKVAPDFSIRLMDETFAKENKAIEKIHNLMIDYFKERPSKMAQDGLQSLKLTNAGIYFLPFLNAVGQHFRFSGQSIPNRSDVRNKYGSKIYFDYIATKQREERAKNLSRSVLQDKSLADDIDSIETIVYHVSSHETGHAIYNLVGLMDILKSTTKSLLEEPRAELTSLHTLKLILEKGLVSEEQMNRILTSFMLQDLRRFSMFDTSAIRPYTISAMSCWDQAHQLGMVEISDKNKVVINKGEVMKKFLDKKSQQFEEILDAEDAQDAEAIEATLARMEASEQSEIVQFLVDQLFHKRVQDVA